MSTGVRFSMSSANSKGKEPITKQRIQFHIDSVAGLPTDISSSSAASVGVVITGQQQDTLHETGSVKPAAPSIRQWHENIGPIPLRETSEITFTLRIKSMTLLGKRYGKVVAKTETLSLQTLLAMQGNTVRSRETRLALPFTRSDGTQSACGTLSLNIRIIPSLTVPIGTDISRYMRAASLHRRSPSSSLSISPSPTLESDEGYSSSSISIASSGGPTTPINDFVMPMKMMLGGEGSKPGHAMSMSIPVIVTTAPSP